MPTVKIYDRASEFRIEITGRFHSHAVDEVARVWHNAMRAPATRQCTVDISQLSGYDSAGLKLLRDMHHHGTQIAAATPESLVFLSEISAPRRRGPALVREKPSNRPAAPTLRMRAAGE